MWMQVEANEMLHKGLIVDDANPNKKQEEEKSMEMEKLESSASETILWSVLSFYIGIYQQWSYLTWDVVEP